VGKGEMGINQNTRLPSRRWRSIRTALPRNEVRSNQ
jgi:hypothetical protein